MSTVTEELLLRIAVAGGAVAAAEVAGFEDAIASADRTAGKATKTFSGLHSLWLTMGGIGLAAGVVQSVKQFASFQRQMEMLHTQTGATTQEVKNATKAVMGMAIEVGTGPNSLAQALYHIESTQVRGKKAYDELKIAAEGAKVGNANLVDVTNALNAVLVGKLIPATGGFKAAMGQLNATVGSGDMYMQDLASAYSTGILSSMKQVGLKLIDINAAMATLGDNNIRGTQAANRLRMGLLQVVKPTNAAADALHALHMKTYQLADDYYKPHGLYVMLQDLHDHLDHLGHDQQNNVLMTLFGRGRMSAGVMTLYDQMGRLESKYGAITTGANNFNQAWAGTQQNLSFVLDQLKTMGEVYLIKIGQALIPVVKGIDTFARDLMHGHLWAQTLAAVAIGFGAIYTATKLATGAVAIFTALMDMNPILLALSLVAGAVALLIIRFHGLSGAARAVKHTWHDVLSWLQTAVINVDNFVIRMLDKLHFKIPSWVPLIGGQTFGFNIPQIQTKPQADTYHDPRYAGGVGYADVVGVSGPMRITGNQKTGWYGTTTPAGFDHPVTIRLDAPINVKIDGKTVARAVVKQGLQATARRGSGGPTISDAGAG